VSEEVCSLPHISARGQAAGWLSRQWWLIGACFYLVDAEEILVENRDVFKVWLERDADISQRYVQEGKCTRVLRNVFSVKDKCVQWLFFSGLIAFEMTSRYLLNQRRVRTNYHQLGNGKLWTLYAKMKYIWIRWAQIDCSVCVYTWQWLWRSNTTIGFGELLYSLEE
jgi:hypothetical protein